MAREGLSGAIRRLPLRRLLRAAMGLDAARLDRIQCDQHEPACPDRAMTVPQACHGWVPLLQAGPLALVLLLQLVAQGGARSRRLPVSEGATASL